METTTVSRVWRSATSRMCCGVSPQWNAVPITSPRSPAYETPGSHESKASQVDRRRTRLSFTYRQTARRFRWA